MANNMGALSKPKVTKKKPVRAEIKPYSMMGTKTEYDKKDKIGPFLSELLSFSGQAHRFHLNTKSYARHMALGELYECLPAKIDAVAELYLVEPESMIMEISDMSFDMPEEMLEYIIETANRIGDTGCRAMNNALDDLAMFSKGNLYKLLNLH